MFASFKSDPVYMNILEHLTVDQGKMYASEITCRHAESAIALWSKPEFVAAFSANCAIGSPPVLANFDDLLPRAMPLVGKVSPTQVSGADGGGGEGSREETVRMRRGRGWPEGSKVETVS